MLRNRQTCNWKDNLLLHQRQTSPREEQKTASRTCRTEHVCKHVNRSRWDLDFILQHRFKMLSIMSHRSIVLERLGTVESGTRGAVKQATGLGSQSSRGPETPTILLYVSTSLHLLSWKCVLEYAPLYYIMGWAPLTATKWVLLCFIVLRPCVEVGHRVKLQLRGLYYSSLCLPVSCLIKNHNMENLRSGTTAHCIEGGKNGGLMRGPTAHFCSRAPSQITLAMIK